MFSHLFFAFLILLFITFVPDIPIKPWISSPELAFEAGLILYFSFLALIYFQIKMAAKSKTSIFTSARLLLLSNLEFLFFFSLYHFGFGAHRLLTTGSLLDTLQTPFMFFSLGLYLMGLAWTYYWLVSFKLIKAASALDYTCAQLQFLIPFGLPFAIFSVLFDLLGLIPQWSVLLKQANDSLFYTIILGIGGVFLLILTLIFMPPLIVMSWRCQPLNKVELESRLKTICQQAHFKHAGFKIWNVLRHSYTAGIIGILPRFRYVMFTPPLIEEFTTEEVEAILIHEIGHSAHKHLLIYPFILLGMLTVATYFSFLYVQPLAQFFYQQNQLHPSSFWNYAFALSVFVLYALSLGVYFRLIFGFYSRLFERQADLHIFKFNLSPIYMIQALNHLAVLAGYIHQQPSWHHYSIQQRMDFIQKAIENPNLVLLHDKKVRKWTIIYFILFILNLLLLIKLLS